MLMAQREHFFTREKKERAFYIESKIEVKI